MRTKTSFRDEHAIRAANMVFEERETKDGLDFGHVTIALIVALIGILYVAC